MRRVLAVVTLGMLASVPVSVFAGSLELRAGGFFPRAQSNLFDDDSQLYTVRNSDWNGITGGIEFNVRLARNVEMGFHVDGYSRSVDTGYQVRPDIRQTLKLSIVPAGVTIRLIPTSHRARLAPFVGVGADVFFWKYEEFGNFLDFTQDVATQTGISDSFRSSGVTPGFHVEGGLRVPLSYDISVVGAVRYQFAKANMGDDFRNFSLDLGGASATVGINIHF